MSFNEFIIYMINYFLFTKSFNAFPALNTGAFDAGIFISSLVCGFLPFLAALFLTSKEPKPTNCTFSPLTNASVTTSINAFNVSSALFLCLLFLQPLLLLNQICSFNLPPKKFEICRIYFYTSIIRHNKIKSFFFFELFSLHPLAL